MRFIQTVLLATSLIASSAFAAKTKDEKITFDPAVSAVKWEGKKVTGQHNGVAKIKKGEVVFAGKTLKSGEFEVDMNSIANDDVKDAEYNKKLVTHLKSEDFFDVAKYPTSTLKIKKAKSVEGIVGPTYEIVADLTMRGKTNEVKFPAVIDTKEGKSTLKATLMIDRTKWDLKYGSGKFFKGLGDKMINDEFQVDVDLASK